MRRRRWEGGGHLEAHDREGERADRRRPVPGRKGHTSDRRRCEALRHVRWTHGGGDDAARHALMRRKWNARAPVSDEAVAVGGDCDVWARRDGPAAVDPEDAP